jgi:hypothetical protein
MAIRSLFIWIYMTVIYLTLTFNIDLKEWPCAHMPKIYIMVLNFIEKHASIHFLLIFACKELQHYGCNDLDLWNIKTKQQPDYCPYLIECLYWFSRRSGSSWFFYEFLKSLWTFNMAAVTLTVKISKLAPPEKATMVPCMNHASFQEDLALLNETKSCLVTRNIVNFDWPCTEVMLKCQVFGLTKSTRTIVGYHHAKSQALCQSF